MKLHLRPVVINAHMLYSCLSSTVTSGEVESDDSEGKTVNSHVFAGKGLLFNKSSFTRCQNVQMEIQTSF